jgi:hypothetical protein
LYVYVCVCVAATAAAAAGCIIVGSVIRLVVGGVGVRTRGRKGGRGLRRHRIVNSRTAVVGRRRYESVTRSFISHPTSWSFPKRRNDKRERKTQGDSLIHSRPIKENKRGAHFFFFKKGKKRKKPLWHRTYWCRNAGPAAALLLLLLLFFLTYSSTWSSPSFRYTNIFFFLTVCVCEDIVRIFMAPSFHFFFLFLLYMWPYRRADNTMSLFKKDSQIYILSSRTKLRTANNILLHNTHKKRERRQKKNTRFLFFKIRVADWESRFFFFFWAITFFCVLLSVPFRFFCFLRKK